MTVTKQQQLEFAAKHIEKWKSGYDYAVVEETIDGHLYIRWPSICTSGITKKEWQQARDKMQKQAEQPAQDNSWHERGEFPPVGCECEVKENDGEWHKTHIVGFDDDGYCVYTTPWNSCVRDYDGDGDQSNFRPLRTERENAIDEMIAIIGSQFKFEGYDLHTRIIRSLSEFICDSGYRKVKP